VTGFRGLVGEQLRRTISETRVVGIEGASDTEVLFALVLDRLDAGADPADALASVIAQALALADGKLNLLLSDGHSITATAFGNSLFTLRGAGLAEGGVLVASEPLDDHEAWTRVPDGSVVLAGADRLDVIPLSTPGGNP
jgi:glutamine amidotransferase